VPDTEAARGRGDTPVTDDDLRAALAAADPVRSTDLHADDVDAAGFDAADFDPVTSPRARELLERTMHHHPGITDPPSPTTQASPTRDTGTGSSARPAAGMRRPLLAAAAAACRPGWRRGGVPRLERRGRLPEGRRPGAGAGPAGRRSRPAVVPAGQRGGPRAAAARLRRHRDGRHRRRGAARGGPLVPRRRRHDGRAAQPRALRRRRSSAPPTSGSARTTWCPPTRAP
jgi:hypothetical protein